ncbi:MAG: DUF2948 family protein [Methyloligellaceae bacterium]
MTDLKLIALDKEDLEIISAHLQDAVMRVGDIAYLPKQNKFAALTNRFNWEKVHAEKKRSRKKYERRRSALRIERVLGAQIQNINLRDKDAVLELLALQFEAGDEPEGSISLVFAGGGAVKLYVECIEVELNDLGAAWETKNMPEHSEDLSENS